MIKKTGNLLRLNLLQFFFFFLISLIVSKLFYIQVIKNKEYEALAFNEHWNSEVIQARRGDILSSDGYPLATTKTYYLLYAEPRKVKDVNLYAKALSAILGSQGDRSFEEFLKKQLSQDLYWVSLKHKISEEEKVEIESLKLSGIGFEEEPLRYYPEATLASHILGFVAGGEKNEEQGYFGIEGYFNGDLRGKVGRVLEERSADGSSILFGGYRKIPSQNGRNVLLTINRGVQFLVEHKLKEGVEKYDAESGSVVVVNPSTGEIIAMANYPTFNPSSFEEIKETSEDARIERKNLDVTSVFEPGSVIKPLTVASAIDLNLVNPNTTFDDDGPKVYSGHTVDNWDGKHLGIQTITELLEKSNNIGASWVGTKVGSKSLYEYFKKFGLGELTGVTLEGENTGLLRDFSEWSDIDLATASFGQGISASVLQLAMAFSVFDNNGILMKPKIVSKIIDNNRTIDFSPEQRRRVISPQTTKTLIPMLISAVDKGESRFFNVKGYTIAGKTGTAQIAINGKYDPNKSNATFVGFLPNSPSETKFVMVVKLEEPKASIYAAETAVPLWMSILKELVLYYKISPDRL